MKRCALLLAAVVGSLAVSTPTKAGGDVPPFLQDFFGMVMTEVQKGIVQEEEKRRLQQEQMRLQILRERCERYGIGCEIFYNAPMPAPPPLPNERGYYE